MGDPCPYGMSHIGSLCVYCERNQIRKERDALRAELALIAPPPPTYIYIGGGVRLAGELDRLRAALAAIAPPPWLTPKNIASVPGGPNWHQDEALRADLTGLVRAVGEVLGCESVMCCHCATVLRDAIAPALAKETP